MMSGQQSIRTTLTTYYHNDQRLARFPHLKSLVDKDIEDYVDYHDVCLNYLNLSNFFDKHEIIDDLNNIETFKLIHNEDYTCLHANWRDDFKALLRAIKEYRFTLNDENINGALAHENLLEYLRLMIFFAKTKPDQIAATIPKLQALTVVVQRSRDFIIYPNPKTEQDLFHSTEKLLAEGIDSRKLRKPHESLFAYSCYLTVMLIGALKFTMLLALATYFIGLKTLALGITSTVFGGILNISAMNIEALTLASCLGTVGLAAFIYASRRMVDDLCTPWALNPVEKQVGRVTEGNFKLCGTQTSFFGKRFLPEKIEEQPSLTYALSANCTKM